MTIHVLSKDIKAGTVADVHACPVGRAIQRELKVESHDVRVTMNGITVLGTFTPASTRVRAFIQKFDGGDPVKPFAFRLQRPVELKAAA